MANTLEAQIHQIISHVAREISSTVRGSIAAEVNRLMGGEHAPAPVQRRLGRPPKAAAPMPAAAEPAPRRKLGRPPKKAAPAPAIEAAAAKKAPKAKTGAKSVRRSSEQVTADNDQLLAYIKAHPGQRSEEIQKGLGMARPNIFSGLQTLRGKGRVKMKGIKRGALYTAA